MGIAAQFSLTNAFVAPRTEVMQRARHQFLARSRIAIYKDRRIGGRNGFDLAQHAAQRRAFADDFLELQLAADLVFEIDFSCASRSFSSAICP